MLYREVGEFKTSYAQDSQTFPIKFDRYRYYFVIIVGLLDLLGIGRGTLADTNWLGLSYEIYFFVSLVFFIFTFGMSRYSLYLEKKLKTGINMGAD